MHIPWPQSDYWTVLPEHLRRAVHDGLLANDVVGFHTDRWRRNFVRSCEDVLDAEVDWDGRRDPLRRAATRSCRPTRSPSTRPSSTS